MEQELEKALAALKKGGDAMKSHMKMMAAHHDEMHKAHAEMCETHKAHAGMCKAKADAMPDDHADKAYYSKVSEHHTTKAAHHEKMAAMHKACAEKLTKAGDGDFTGDMPPAPSGDGTPASLGDAGKATGVEDLIKQTTTGLVTESLKMLKSDNTVQDAIRQMVLEGVKKALGGTAVPDSVRLFPPTAPQGDLLKGLTLVNRPGGAPLPGEQQIDADKMDPKVADLIGA